MSTQQEDSAHRRQAHEMWAKLMIHAWKHFWKHIPSGGLFLIALLSLMLPETCRADVDFDRIHGSDLGMGIGARAIAMSGAFVAVADDATAVFWNPAGLSQLKSNQLFLSADLPADFSSAGLVLRPRNKTLYNNGFAFGLSYINRLSFSGDSGDTPWSGYAAHILNLAMIDPGDDFIGSIDSKTYDVRLSLAYRPQQWDKISFGLNFIHLD